MLRPGVTDRVVRLFEAIRAYGPPRVALERAVYFTESFKTTEGQPLVWRWAKPKETGLVPQIGGVALHLLLCQGHGDESSS
jgi:hypothetical protein